MDWLLHQQIMLLIVAPLVGLAVIALIPTQDASSSRKLAMVIVMFLSVPLVSAALDLSKGLQISSSLIHLVTATSGSNTLALKANQIAPLFVTWLGLFGLFFMYTNKDGTINKIFIFTSILLMIASFLASFCTTLTASLIVGNVASMIFLYQLMLFGKSPKGKAILFVATYLLLVDIAAILCLTFIQAMITSEQGKLTFFIVVALPILSRLVITGAAPWTRLLSRSCSTELLYIFTCTICAIAAVQAIKFAEIVATLNIKLETVIWLAAFCATSTLVSGFISLRQKKLAQSFFFYIPLYSSIFIVTLLLPNTIDFENASTLFSTGLVCVLIGMSSSNILEHSQRLTAARASLALVLGVPGIGVGTSIWITLSTISYKDILSLEPYVKTVFVVCALMFCSYLLLCISSFHKILDRKIRFSKAAHKNREAEFNSLNLARYWMVYFAILIGSLLAPIWPVFVRN